MLNNIKVKGSKCFELKHWHHTLVRILLLYLKVTSLSTILETCAKRIICYLHVVLVNSWDQSLYRTYSSRSFSSVALRETCVGAFNCWRSNVINLICVYILRVQINGCGLADFIHLWIYVVYMIWMDYRIRLALVVPAAVDTSRVRTFRYNGVEYERLRDMNVLRVKMY